jgi:ABC-type nitrate/sulfonate/bicarbonate transport system substrate-binding protein
MRCACTLALLAAVVAPAEPPQKVIQPLQKITLNFPTRSGASWPLFIAKEGGYYQKYGLDATLVFAGHPSGIAMVVSGEAQMSSYSLESVMQAAPRDPDLVVVGSSLNKAYFALMARKEIASVKDLKHKRFAVSFIGDPPYNYAVALLRNFGLTSRDVEWQAVGTDANGRAAALAGGRVDATLLTPPAYFKLEESGYKLLANVADYDNIYASTTYLMKREAIAANPKLPESLIQAHAEAIQRFYQDKAFAVKAYQAYDPQPAADVERVYDGYAKGNLLERVPYVLAAALKSVMDQQTDPQLAAVMKGFDFHKTIDNSLVDRLVKKGYFEKLFGSSIKPEEQRKSKLAYR